LAAGITAAATADHGPGLGAGTEPGIDPGTEFSVSLPWAGPVLAAAVALAVFAPGGLYLMGFLGLVIITHELGHFAVARRAGIRPTELFWGFGPEVVAVQVGGCRYGVKALFIGGYVKLEGMTPSSTIPTGFAEADTYRGASRRGRLATILAGPAVNLTLALASFWLANLLAGDPAARAFSTAVGDLWAVVAATGQALWTWIANLGPYIAAVWDSSGATEAPVRFLSPVGQADVSQQAVALGPRAGLQWFGILAAAVGIVNLLPLPPLDGSHAVVVTAEAVLDRLRPARDGSGDAARLDVARLVPLAYVTIGLLLALSVSALILDVRDLTVG
jgi:membrane-associated protease RseP (regulator of RpoE activity)